MTKIIHSFAGGAALATILSFWGSTVWSEVFGDRAAVVLVKTLIPWGFLILVPMLATAGATGFRLARGRRGGLVARKRSRMPVIAANGVLILIPSALYLSAKAQAGDFDAAFVAVQMLELGAGAVNLALIGLNLRDGRRLSGRRALLAA